MSDEGQSADVTTQYHEVPVTNNAGEEIPAFALVRDTGASTDGVMTVAKPNTDGQFVWVSGHIPIASGGEGAVLAGTGPFYALYETGDGTPASGETWGAGNGSFKLQKDLDGFIIIGGQVDGRVLVRRANCS